MENQIKGGKADNMTLEDIAKKHNVDIKFLRKQVVKGIKVEMEHTNDPKKAKEIVYDHLFESACYYEELSKMEKKLGQSGCGSKGDKTEQTMSGAAGSFESPMGAGAIKRPISTIHNSEISEDDEVKKGEYKEATTSAVSAGAQYDVPLGGSGRHVKGKRTQADALKLDNVEGIKASKIGKTESSPYNYGVDVKEKCRTFPYCNQGDINALKITKLSEAINVVAKERGLPVEDVEKIVLKEIRDIFMVYETERNK